MAPDNSSEARLTKGIGAGQTTQETSGARRPPPQKKKKKTRYLVISPGILQERNLAPNLTDADLYTAMRQEPERFVAFPVLRDLE